MDMSDYLTLWETMGNTWVSWSAKEAHYTLFVNKEGDVVGHFKSTGYGIFYELPEEIVEHKKKLKHSIGV